MNRKVLGSFFLLSIPAFVPYIGEAKAETVTEALAYTYVENPEIKSQWNQVLIAREKVNQKRAGYELNVLGKASYGYDDYHNVVRENETRKDDKHRPFEYGVVATQPIFSGFSTVNSVSAAERYADSVKYGFNSLVQDKLLEAVKAYSEVYAAGHILNMNIHNEKVLKKDLEKSQDRYRVGELTKTDKEQAAARYAKAVSNRIDAQANLDIAIANYEKIVCAKPIIEELFEPDVLSVKLPETLDDAIDIAKKNNPEILQAKSLEDWSKKNVSVAKAEYSPSLYAQAKYQNLKADVYGGRVIDRSVGVVLEVPFYKTSEVSSKVREAVKSKEQARINIISVQNIVVNKVIEAWKKYYSTKEEQKALEEQIRANEVALSGVRSEEQAGTRTVLDVLNAEQELLESKVSLINAKKNLWISSYSLLASMGKMNFKDLELDIGKYKKVNNVEEKPISETKAEPKEEVSSVEEINNQNEENEKKEEAVGSESLNSENKVEDIVNKND
ncbi:MAG: TolC family outer membrane protein [Alphaproteobacteria bacterium]|nr:TolC family outer membrane protein [Alphaproteobacteria bacterium]